MPLAPAGNVRATNGATGSARHGQRTSAIPSPQPVSVTAATTNTATGPSRRTHRLMGPTLPAAGRGEQESSRSSPCETLAGQRDNTFWSVDRTGP
ncbi:hypothetical protein Asera_32910 [Actinocatenispora sera]|uniref:Uncharacterized protein n=1 Tax=Actinocatenispora sera TaxID=390989 RepID=A0A810L196_9ACTN|nr:hypothetical protein Asera_32910 [Actinocatenispora sera]